MTTFKNALCTIAGAVGGFVVYLFGGWSEDLITLIIFMSIDFLMGVILALVFKKSNKTESGAYNSHAGWIGLIKKCVTLLFILIAHRLDMVLSTEYIRTATIIGFIVNEVISIVENAGLMGIPLPGVIKRAIEILKKKVEDDEPQN